MSDGLPRQCRWSDFVRIVQSLGYEELRSRRDGSARSFRQLGLSREEFLGRLRNDH